MIVIEPYSPIYKNAVIELICNEYGYNKQIYADYFEAFYDKKYQDKSILIIALDNNKVIGFQSFFYWPYILNKKKYNSFQSGNSIIDGSYRGKGVFKRMLNFIEENEFNIDFIVGFPVEASYYSFMKTNWKNPFNLHWYLKINRLFSVFRKPNYKLLERNFQTSQRNDLINSAIFTTISDDIAFINWRNTCYRDKHFFYTYSKDNNICEIGFKLNIRKKYLKEVIIGQINGNIDNILFVKEAVQTFLNEIKKINSITFISIAINSSNMNYIGIIEQLNFKKTKKKIYFIIKEMKVKFSENEYNNWLILRGDIDTW